MIPRDATDASTVEMPPATLEVRPEGIPEELRRLSRWVCWRWELRNGKWTKPPYQARSGRYAVSTDPRTWATFDEALAAYRHGRGRYAGVGYALHRDDDIVGIDLDKARDPATGQLVPWARPILERLPTYVEASPSATGFRSIGRGRYPREKGTKRSYQGGVVEVYGWGRYLTFTGHRLPDHPQHLAELGSNVDWLLRLIDPTEEPNASIRTRGTGELSDQELLERMFAATNGAAIRALWSGDTSGYSSHSEADLALCNHLAFYTRKDARRMDALFRQSGLFRAKWGERHGERTYGEMTIAKAIAGCSEVYGSGSRSSQPSASETAEQARLLTLTVADQLRSDCSLRRLFREILNGDD